MPRKLILSRKGFDGSAGGKPSPILDNKFVSLPIPSADSGFFYKDMKFSSEENYLKIMKDLGIKMYSEAHLDPDLQRSLLDNRPEEWRGLFGQSGISQGTLHNRAVGEGDIFLFFGWFKEARKEDGVWKYVPHAPDVHAIFGYLEVDRELDIRVGDSIPSWAAYHPHIKHSHEHAKGRNSVYVATSTFSKHANQPGWGSFHYDPRLVLTHEEKTTRSFWKLPACFQGEQDQFTSRIKTWNVLRDGMVEMQTVGRGDQEMYVSSNPEVVAWAEELIMKCSVYE
ncbi:hypothetical protein EPH95_05870 [Salicibibacter halophilus]|uniref:Nucleotide modification associated domain-containing protein n=1 Tax=Salicibibacter halophilus TaxID=2502791 RepID=A0A514LFY3_9BACI|nr:hypothetical protein [Salicibibacter halophilus]QDI90764.1 hypothetical protein EPH95_05870 [Salicibibacter halophilus]